MSIKTKLEIEEEIKIYPVIRDLAQKQILTILSFIHKIREEDREEIKREIADCIPLKTTRSNKEYNEGVNDTIDDIYFNLNQKNLLK